MVLFLLLWLKVLTTIMINDAGGSVEDGVVLVAIAIAVAVVFAQGVDTIMMIDDVGEVDGNDDRMMVMLLVVITGMRLMSLFDHLFFQVLYHHSPMISLKRNPNLPLLPPPRVTASL